MSGKKSDEKMEMVWVEMGFPVEMMRLVVSRLGIYDEKEEMGVFTMFVGNALKLAFQTVLREMTAEDGEEVVN